VFRYAGVDFSSFLDFSLFRYAGVDFSSFWIFVVLGSGRSNPQHHRPCRKNAKQMSTVAVAVASSRSRTWWYVNHVCRWSILFRLARRINVCGTNKRFRSTEQLQTILRLCRSSFGRFYDCVEAASDDSTIVFACLHCCSHDRPTDAASFRHLCRTVHRRRDEWPKNAPCLRRLVLFTLCSSM